MTEEKSKWLLKYERWKRTTLLGKLFGQAIEDTIPVATFCVNCILVVVIIVTILAFLCGVSLKILGSD